MKAIGSGGEWWWNLPSLRRKSNSRRRNNTDPRGHRNTEPRGRRSGPPRESLSSSSSESIEQGRGWSIDFPFRQAVTAASLTLAGDTIAQVRGRIVDRQRRGAEPDSKELIPDILLDHDWLRALRMASYGFLLYGPGSYAWYQFLDRCMPKQTFANMSAKVILNQIVLGPCVISVVFAWNNLWQGKLSELPSKYQNDALPALLYGFRFWVPVSIVNFGLIPLSARVAFMSSCSIFWNYYLSTTMSNEIFSSSAWLIVSAPVDVCHHLNQLLWSPDVKHLYLSTAKARSSCYVLPIQNVFLLMLLVRFVQAGIKVL